MTTTMTSGPSHRSERLRDHLGLEPGAEVERAPAGREVGRPARPVQGESAPPGASKLRGTPHRRRPMTAPAARYDGAKAPIAYWRLHLLDIVPDHSELARPTAAATAACDQRPATSPRADASPPTRSPTSALRLEDPREAVAELRQDRREKARRRAASGAAAARDSRATRDPPERTFSQRDSDLAVEPVGAPRSGAHHDSGGIPPQARAEGSNPCPPSSTRRSAHDDQRTGERQRARHSRGRCSPAAPRTAGHLGLRALRGLPEAAVLGLRLAAQGGGDEQIAQAARDAARRRLRVDLEAQDRPPFDDVLRLVVGARPVRPGAARTVDAALRDSGRAARRPPRRTRGSRSRRQSLPPGASRPRTRSTTRGAKSRRRW